MRVIIMLLVIATTGCSTTRVFFEVGIGDNSGNWEDCGNTGSYVGGGFTGPVMDHVVWEVGYEHHSQWNCGYPHNSKQESFLNHWGAKVRFVY